MANDREVLGEPLALKFCRLLKNAIKDEQKADKEYAELCVAAYDSNVPTANRICNELAEIARDERQHKRKLESIHEGYC